jgi:hypothetical protein
VKGTPREILAVSICAFGWFSSLTYALHLIGPYHHACENGDAFPYLASMIAGPATLLLAALMLTIASVLGVVVRWPALLHVATLGVAIHLLPDYLVNTTVEGRFICVSNAAGGPADFDTSTWQRAFVPVQNAAIAAFAGFLLWYRRSGGAARPRSQAES